MPGKSCLLKMARGRPYQKGWIIVRKSARCAGEVNLARSGATAVPLRNLSDDRAKGVAPIIGNLAGFRRGERGALRHHEQKRARGRVGRRMSYLKIAPSLRAGSGLRPSGRHQRGGGGECSMALARALEKVPESSGLFRNVPCTRKWRNEPNWYTPRQRKIGRLEVALSRGMRVMTEQSNRCESLEDTPWTP